MSKTIKYTKKQVLLFFTPALLCITSSLWAQLIIQKGITLSCTGNALVTLQDIDLVVSGGLTQDPGTAHFLFTGNGNNAIAGDNQPQFDILEIAKTGSAGISLQQGIVVAGAIRFTNGGIDLNNSNILLRPGAVLSNENETSRITGMAGGYIQASADLNAPAVANPGNLGLLISTTQNLGSTVVRRGHVSQSNASGGGNSVLRYYDIIPTVNTGLNASLIFNYFDAELNVQDENALVLWKNTGNQHWANQGFLSRSAAANYVTQSGINDFSRFTLASFNSALPVLLAMFNVQCHNGAALITWTTTQEENNSQFILQKSSDGLSWQKIGSIPGAGNSNIKRDYSYTYTLSQETQCYYRIGSEDINGRLQFNKALWLSCNGSNQAVTVHPNPVSDLLWVSIPLTYSQRIKTTLTSSEGRLVHTQTNSFSPGNTAFSIVTKTHASGMYLLTLQKEDGTVISSIKIIKH